MTDILTRIKVKEERIIPVGFGKAIEYKFTTNFTPSPGIVGSSKQVVVNVRQRGDVTAILAEVEILLIKPNQAQEAGTTSAPVNIQAKINPPLGTIKFAVKPGIPVFDDIDEIGPADPPLPPPAHLTRFKYLIKENDPNGTDYSN